MMADQNTSPANPSGHDPQNPPTRKTQKQNGLRQHLLPFAGVVGALFSFVLIYLAYDYSTVHSSPCESIFQQTSVGLSTRISLLKTEGEISIGREPLVDLTERAQMTALNLKTCCTVLEAGKLNPEQFLQCKAKTRSYERKLDEIVALVRKTPPAANTKTQPIKTTGTTANPSIQSTRAAVQTKIKAAQQISKTFNKEIVKVRSENALETLKLMPPKHVDVSAREQEPNNNNLTTNNIPLKSWVTAAISDPKDIDFYSFETPAEHRDWIKIEIDNRSTSFEPRIRLYDANKKHLVSHHSTTAGSNLTYSFVAPPNARYSVAASNYYGNSTGGYLIRVTPTKAYDAFEPNNTVPTATKVAAGKEIEASIMDGKDLDVFKIQPPSGTNQMIAVIENASTSLRPRIDAYNSRKSHIGSLHDTTAGSDITFSRDINPDGPVYVQVSDYYREAGGKYRLTVKFQTKKTK